MDDDVLVLWDIDGTLLNSGGAGGDLFNAVFAELFGRSLETATPRKGRTDRAIILETLSQAGVPEPRRYVDPFIAGMSAQVPTVRADIVTRGQALAGAEAVLAALTYPEGLPLGSPRRVHQSVLTGNIRQVAEAKLAALGLREPLDLAIGAYGDDHEDRAQLVQVARRRAATVHGRSPSDFAGAATVLVGDTPRDVLAAVESRARSVGVATGRFTVADLAAAGADVVLPDLTDVPAVLKALLPGGGADARHAGTARQAAPGSGALMASPA